MSVLTGDAGVDFKGSVRVETGCEAQRVRNAIILTSNRVLTRHEVPASQEAYGREEYGDIITQTKPNLACIGNFSKATDAIATKQTVFVS